MAHRTAGPQLARARRYNILHSGQHPWRHLREAPAYSDEGTRVDRGKLDEYVGRSLMLVTALSPDIGYDRASAIGV